jgi:hypothetical protein
LGKRSANGTEASSATRKRSGNRLGNTRRTRKQGAPSLLQEDYLLELPAAWPVQSGAIDNERERDEISRQAYELIDRLVKLRPSGPFPGADPETASEALAVAGQLFGLLAGWAVWHELAAAARRAGVELGPTQLWVSSARERLIPSDGRVILHQLDAMLRIFQGCFPLSGSELVRDQIGELLGGSDSIVFRPQKGRPHNKQGKQGVRLWVLRARAVAHVEYFVKCGMQKTKARKMVAKEYEQASSKNIEMWGRRASEVVGANTVEWFLDRARQDARQSFGFRAFGEEQLKKDGQNYDRLLKNKELLGPDKARSTVLILRDPDRPGVHMEARRP